MVNTTDDAADEQLVRTLFTCKQNAVDAVLTTLGKYIQKNHSEFFDVGNWQEIVIGCFGNDLINTTRFSLNASIPATQEPCRTRIYTAKPKTTSNDIVLATTPEPSSLHPASTLRIPDDDNDLCFIPETQQFTQKPTTNEDEDSNDSFIQVQPAEYNTWLPETQSQFPDSRSNSPAATQNGDGKEIDQILNSAVVGDSDETDCEEEMSALNWKEKSVSFAAEVHRADECGSVTPDLLFEAVIGEEKTVTNPAPLVGNTLNENLDDEIPISQQVFQAARPLDADPTDGIDIFDVETQMVEPANTSLPRRRSKRKPSFDDASTQLFPSKVKSLAKPNGIFDLETQPILDTHHKRTTFDDAPTQMFISPKRSVENSSANKSSKSLAKPNGIFDLETQPILDTHHKRTSFDDAPTQMFIPPKRSVENGSTVFETMTDSGFNDSTQLFVNPSSSQNEKPDSDDDDIFNQPTQKFQSDIRPKSQFNSFIQPNNPESPTCIGIDFAAAPAEDDIFLAPTQKFVIPKRQASDDTDDVFSAPTQRLLSSSDQEPSIYDASTQAYDVDVIPRPSRAYSPSASALSSLSTPSCSQSDKENKQQTNKSNKKQSAKPALAKLLRKASSTMEFDTPQYNFLKFADPDKIRQIDEEMSRKQTKLRFLFQDSSDESGSDSELLSKIAVKHLNEISRAKPTPKVHVPKAPSAEKEKIPDSTTTSMRQSKSKQPPVEEPVVVHEPKVRSSRRTPRNAKEVSKDKSVKSVQSSKDKQQPTEVLSSDSECMPVVRKRMHRNTKGLAKDTLAKRAQIHHGDQQTTVLLSSDSDSSPMVRKRLRGRNVIVKKDSKSKQKDHQNSVVPNPVVKLVRLSANLDDVPVLPNVVQPNILFTIVDPKPHNETIEMIGGILVDSPSTCTVLVTNRVNRTCKFLSAMGRGTPIVSEQWISECAKQRRYVDPKDFILQDAVSEKRYKFNLVQSLAAARDQPIFANMSFVVTPSTKPLPKELHSIITCAAGHSILQPDTGSARRGDTVIGVSCRDDRAMWPKIQKRHPGILMISTEGLMLSVMQHRINFKPYQLK